MVHTSSKISNRVLVCSEKQVSTEATTPDQDEEETEGFRFVWCVAFICKIINIG